MDQFQFLRELGTLYLLDPPPADGMEYPCMVLDRGQGDTKFADDRPYVYTQGYSLTVMSWAAEDPLLALVQALPRCVHNRHFVKDNLHHDVHTIFIPKGPAT